MPDRDREPFDDTVFRLIPRPPGGGGITDPGSPNPDPPDPDPPDLPGLPDPPDPDPPDDPPDPDPPDPDPPEPDPDFGVDIQSIDARSGSVEATVKVTVSNVDVASYELDVNDSATAQNDRVNSVVSPNDPDTIVFEFDPGSETSGTITATFIEPPEAVGAQDQVGWSYDPFNEGNVQITGCSVNTGVIDPGENGSISFTVSNDNPVNAEFDWRVSVDGSFAESGTNTLLDGSTQTFTATIPARSLSEGDNSVSVTVSDAREN